MARMTKREERRLIKNLRRNITPTRLRRIRDYRIVRVGDTVRCSRNGYPMTVTGILKTYYKMDDLAEATLYLDFEDNCGDIWEENLSDVELCGCWLSVLWKKISRRLS